MIWIILLYFAVGSKLLNAKTVYLVPLGILFILITGFGGYQYGAEFVLYYILGIYLCLWVEKKHVVITNSILAPLYLLVAVISFVLCKEYVDFYSVSITQLLNNHKIVFFILRQVCGISWSLFFICLIRRFSIRYTKFSFYGKNSLPFYTIHACIIIMLRPLHLSFDLNFWSYWLVTIPATLAIVFFTCICINVLSKNKYSNALFLGNIQ